MILFYKYFYSFSFLIINLIYKKNIFKMSILKKIDKKKKIFDTYLISYHGINRSHIKGIKKFIDNIFHHLIILFYI